MRQREIETIFQNVPPETFDEALELGGGDGFQSRFLAAYAKRVVCTDLNSGRLIQDPHPKIAYEICDAEDLPYETGRFDLIYSSNLLEHLPDSARALSEMFRVLSVDGIMVHVVPNRLWKISQFVLFIPNQLQTMVEIVLSSDRRNSIGYVEGSTSNPRRSPAPFLVRNAWPEVHGENPNHLVEFVRMGAAHWDQMFSVAGFSVAGHVAGLPFHSPYRFGLESPRKLLEKLGLSSSNGFILTKSGSRQDKVRFFIAEGRPVEI